jgi:Flp pilus assembly protein TadG
MKSLRFFRRDKRGVGAVEFALICPVFFGMLVGITQLGQLYFARADLRNAVAAGARQAQIFPRPNEATVKTKVLEKAVRLKPAYLTGPSVTPGTDARGFPFYDIQASYAVPLHFVIYVPRPITVTERRRVYLTPAN